MSESYSYRKTVLAGFAFGIAGIAMYYSWNMYKKSKPTVEPTAEPKFEPKEDLIECSDCAECINEECKKVKKIRKVD